MEILTPFATKASTSEQFTLIGSPQVGADYPYREPFICTHLAHTGKLDDILPS